MKKLEISDIAIICLTVTACLALCLTGIFHIINNNRSPEAPGLPRIVLISDDGTKRIYQDTMTGVQYFSNSDGLVLLVNADGSPYTGEAGK